MAKRLFTFFIFLTIVGGGLYAAYYYLYDKNVEANVTISLPRPVNRGPIQQTVYIDVPAGNYDEEFALKLGKENWKIAKALYRKKAGLLRFMPGDIFVMETFLGKVRQFSLHHYSNRTTGKEIIFKKFRGQFVKKESHIGLIVRTMTRYFPIHTTFKKEYAQFYQKAKKRMLWDWGILDMLEPNDSAVFIIKGIFDGETLVHLYGIMGFAVKSKSIGDFTLTLHRDELYGDYFAAASSRFISPSGFFKTPIDYAKITSDFGYRKDPFTRRRKFHNGVDLIAKIGTPIYAAQDGKVIFSGRKGGFGKTLIIEHKDGFRTLYAHCHSLLVSSGNSVKMGDNVALVGNSGRSTASHLHFTVYKDGEAVDPFNYTYERSWATPFDIGTTFQSSSIKRASCMLKGLDNRTTFFNDTPILAQQDLIETTNNGTTKQ